MTGWTADSIPKLARHARLIRDTTRNATVLLVPERVITPSETAVAVLELCDGTRRVRDIAAQLAEAYDADAGDILGDILPLIEALATERHVVDASAHDAA